ncbi:hypothetical protein HMN09_00783800 [Mycena chlorophos]|uniref:Uncharacterized protein n=1 Tax=Mycena chlorophos TaxID=658473 RepID=A0A8H6SWQ4_MYCCL|nr:hypothetical protein HMN09_00783800 [Mycena chlorophos]
MARLPGDELRTEVDPPRIEVTNLKLVSLTTRNTMSSQTNMTRRIAAVRDWNVAQMEAVAVTSGECGRSCAQSSDTDRPHHLALQASFVAGATQIHDCDDERAFRALNL